MADRYLPSSNSLNTLTASRVNSAVGIRESCRSLFRLWVSYFQGVRSEYCAHVRIGNPSVVLIDEYSTGIDPATKRQMWRTLRSLSPGKAVVITTHSMEEAAALSDRVAIVSGSLLGESPASRIQLRLLIRVLFASNRNDRGLGVPTSVL